jgi:hypothetical protein
MPGMITGEGYALPSHHLPLILKRSAIEDR